MILGLAVIYVVWGSTFLAIAYVVKTLPAVITTGVRYGVSGALLCAWASVRGAPKPTADQWRSAAIAGALLVVGGTATVAWAEQWLPSGLTALLASTVPLWIVLGEWWMPRGRRPHAFVLGGIALGLVGLIVLTAPAATGPTGVDLRTVGPAVVLTIAAMAWAAGSLYTRGAPLPSSPMLGMGMQMLSGGILCVVAGFAIGEHGAIDLARVSTASWIAFAYLTVAGSLVAFTTYLWLLRVTTPALVSTHAFVNPVVAVLLGWAVGREQITTRIIVAGGLIIAAVILITWKQPDAAPDPAHPAVPAEPS